MARGLALVGLVLAGCATDGSDAVVSPTSDVAPTLAESTTTTVAVSRDWPYPVDFVNCNLPRLLTNTSHLLMVTGSTPQTDEIPVYSDTDEGHSTYSIDTADATVDEVVAVRGVDPRQEYFPTFHAGDSLHLESMLEGSVLADIEGTSTLVAVGQSAYDAPEKWTIHAAFTIDEDGLVGFIGGCAPEFDRQFSSIAGGLGARTDLEFLAQMVDEALTPGRTLDLDYFARPPEARYVSFESVPPAIAGKLRVIGLYVTPTGGGEGVVGMGGEYGVSALSTVTAAGGRGWLLPAAVPAHGPAQFIQYADGEALGGVSKVILEIPTADLEGVDAIHVTLDTNTMTATWEPIGREQLAMLSGSSVEYLDQAKVLYQGQLDTPGTAKGEPQFSGPSY